MIQLIPIAMAGGYLCAAVAHRIAHKRAPQPAPVKPGEIMIHFVKEFVEAENEVVVAVEEFPLDNRHSQTALVSELSFSRSAITRIHVEQAKGRGFELQGSLFKALEKKTKNHLTQILNLSLEGETRREVKLRLSAEPHTENLYRLTWKQQGQRGYQEVEVGGRFYQLPFFVTYGLSVTVESLPVAAA
ncbi:hypothetical protein Mmc1_3316 [Magnetococcus marinus MC-1]|uniref:Uncharacterized protein n=1 Tax=Magnetococcus marinus (strain ATCC BAA-1437 / JCM 17883 / MC-1) TaxID=156889 RepID=A0LCW2_MAGMM|nr:hypothetical protein [Magnetococcus marinus]ABK45805.1 hypothetical protein Mmc1_3316 [Magnetococcus marinus MC-1]